jgi:hypothetical protein
MMPLNIKDNHMLYVDNSNCTYIEQYNDGIHEYIFTGPCIISNETVKVTVKGGDLFAYRNGALIQNAFPYLTAQEREWMMSGIYNWSDGYDDLFEEE